MNDINKLIAERDAYLKQHPHLQPLQDALDIVMDKLSPTDRMTYLGSKLDEQLNRLVEQLELLKKHT